MALTGSLGTPAGSGCVTGLARVVALALLARLLFGSRFRCGSYSLLGSLSLPLGLHELGHDLELVMVLLQSS